MMILMLHDWNSFFKYFLIYVLCVKIYALLFLIFSIDDVSILSFPAKLTTLHAQDRSIGPFPFPLDNPPLIEYSFSDRNVRSAHALWTSRRESERNQDGSMNFQPFEQYQLSCIEERPSGAALIFYLSNFNIAWIFITETNAEISNQDASLWDVFLICLPARLVLLARAGF